MPGSVAKARPRISAVKAVEGGGFEVEAVGFRFVEELEEVLFFFGGVDEDVGGVGGGVGFEFGSLQFGILWGERVARVPLGCGWIL